MEHIVGILDGTPGALLVNSKKVKEEAAKSMHQVSRCNVHTLQQFYQ